MTWRLWLADAVKGVLLAIVIGGPLIALVLWIMAASGSLWWLWAWCAWAAFNLIALVLVPTVIAPLFNRFEPLADASLEARVRALMARAGFAAKGLFVMDGSRRSRPRQCLFHRLRRGCAASSSSTTLLHPAGAGRSGGGAGARARPLQARPHRAPDRRRCLRRSLAGLRALFGWAGFRHSSWFYTGLGVRPPLARSQRRAGRC